MSIIVSVSDQNALDSHAELVNRAHEYIDAQVTVATLEQMVGLVDAEINRRLALKPVRPQMVRVPVIISSEFVAQPELMQKPISMEMSDGTKTYPVDYVDPVNITSGITNPERYDRPTKYTVEGSNFRFFPAPSNSYTASFLYFKKVKALNEESQSNWFLTDNPDVYLDGLLHHAYKFLPDISKAEAHWQLFDTMLDKVLSAYPKAPKNIKLRTERALYQNTGWENYT